MKLNLKLVAASMSMLGLISCPAFAYDQNQQNVKQLRSSTQAHQNYKDEGMVYKDMGPICPVVSMYTLLTDSMSQNVGRAKPTVDCDKPIQLAGGINFDTLWGNRHRGYQGETYTRFALNDAYINFTGNVNSWVKAFLELSYTNMNEEPLFTEIEEGDATFGIYSHAYTHGLDLQQGIITIGAPERYPLFLRLGKQFFDYGRYQIHPMTRSFTQVLTETLQTGAELSFISGWDGMALHGSIFAFENPMSKDDDDDAFFFNEHLGKTNYGGQLGLGVLNGQFGWDIGVGYLYDFTGVNDVAYGVTLFSNDSTDGEGTYEDRVDAGNIYAMVNSGPFSLAAHYATALQHFNSTDLSAPDDDDDDDNDGAKPWAADITVAYGFNAFEKSQNLYASYQVSGEAVNLFLPRTRWLVGYGVDALKNTNVGFELSHDQDYSEGDGGTGDGSFRGILRVGVKFG